jgi:hypothetical protein
MDIEQLAHWLNAKVSAAPAGADAWARAEKQLGIPLPETYKAYIDRFGVGQICQFLIVHSPFAKNLSFNLRNVHEMNALLLKQIQTDTLETLGTIPFFPLYPELEGLLCFATSANGDVLSWRTVGPSAAWPIVWWSTRNPGYDIYSSSLIELIDALITGRLQGQHLNFEEPLDCSTFEPLD